MKKTIFIIVFISIFSLVGLFWWIADSLFPPDKNKMERYFKQDKSDIILITEYLINSDYLKIRINDSDISNKKIFMFTGLETGNVEITNDTVVQAINRLYKKRGYSVIGRNGNTIHFQKWTRLMDFGSGIAYSIDGSKPTEDEIGYLTHLEPLSESKWYFYEEDYNEWRLQHDSP